MLNPARKRADPLVLQLKLTLIESDPPIWRRFLVDDASTLFHLHRIIQILMGWWDYHLFEFEVDGNRYAHHEPEWEEDVWEDASLVTLRSLKLRRGSRFLYKYDFGDAWRMEIDVERRRQGGPHWILPYLLEGERAGPPEDCGGVSGLERILRALEEPRSATRPTDDDYDDPDEAERERRELLEWLGDYDPAAFDRRAVNHFLVLAAGWEALGP